MEAKIQELLDKAKTKPIQDWEFDFDPTADIFEEDWETEEQATEELTEVEGIALTDLNLTEQMQNNLRQVCKNYSFLLHKAVGFTKLELSQDTTVFGGFDKTNTAHQFLAEKIVGFAKRATKVQEKAVLQLENEKFAFRVWLVRLGWKDKETTKERQSLYKNLAGNSAFCTETSKAKWAKKGI